MRKFGSGFMALMFVIGLLVAGPATVSAAGWTQRFQEDSVGPFYAMEVFMQTPGASFESPAFANFSTAGWTSTSPNSRYALATGSATTWMQFDINFNGSQSAPFKFDFFAYSGSGFGADGKPAGTVVDSAEASWNGGGWSFVAVPSGRTFDRTDPPPPNAPGAAVPEPATFLLLGSGLVGMGFFGERKFSLKK